MAASSVEARCCRLAEQMITPSRPSANKAAAELNLRMSKRLAKPLGAALLTVSLAASDPMQAPHAGAAVLIGR
jgi:hypothetical protein